MAHDKKQRGHSDVMSTQPLQVLMDEIFFTTRQIQVKFPELYQVLGETPLFMDEKKKTINSTDFEKYFESIQGQLLVFDKRQNRKKGAKGDA